MKKGVGYCYHSYPGCCVIKGRPLVIPSNCVHESGETFINDIHTRVPTICGMATRYITNYPLGLVNQLMNPAVMRYPANTRPAVAMTNYGYSSTGGSLPSTGGSLPSTGASLPSTGGSLPSTGGSLPSSCYGSSKRVQRGTCPAVPASGSSVSASSSNGSFKRRRLTDEEEGLSSKRYQTEPDVKCIPEQEVIITNSIIYFLIIVIAGTGS